MMAIRPYRDSDEGEVVALWEVCGLTRPWNPPCADIALLRGSSHGEILVAMQEKGGVTGSVMVGHDGHRGWIYYLAVSPSCQRSGLGSRLMRAAEAATRARDTQGRTDDARHQYRSDGILCPAGL